MSRRRYAVIATMLLLAVAAALLLAHYRAAAPAAPDMLTIATNTDYVGTCPVVAAQREGYFLAHGLRVQLQPHSSGKQALNAMLARQADMATVADIPIMFAALNGTPVQIAATIFRTGQDHGVVARRDRGIRQGRDLEGKRIGVTLTTSGHFALEVFLNRQRLDTGEVRLRNYAPDRLLQALADGEVDAVSAWEPFLSQIEEKLGAQVVRFSGQDVYDSIYNLAAPGTYLREHPQVVVRLLRALEQGERFCRTQPERALAYMPQLSPQVRAAALAAWPAHQFALELDQSLLLVLEDQARWAIKSGLTDADIEPNFLEYVYLDGLKAVNPAKVTIIY
jgi:NitT/TauT family transport system substrate-binding protein